MVWVKIDDSFPEHPKIAAVGAIGAWVQIQALCYCNRNLTDGYIPVAVASTFGRYGTEHIGIDTGEVKDMATFGEDAAEMDWPAIMVAAKLWERCSGGYKVHDYLDFNPSRKEVLAERRRWAEKKKSRRESRRESMGESSGESTVESPRESALESTGESERPVPVPVPVEEERKNPPLSPPFERGPDQGSDENGRHRKLTEEEVGERLHRRYIEANRGSPKETTLERYKRLKSQAEAEATSKSARP